MRGLLSARRKAMNICPLLKANKLSGARCWPRSIWLFVILSAPLFYLIVFSSLLFSRY